MIIFIRVFVLGGNEIGTSTISQSVPIEGVDEKTYSMVVLNVFALTGGFHYVSPRDEAIELADHALSLTKAERIEEFSSLLSETSNQSKKG